MQGTTIPTDNAALVELAALCHDFLSPYTGLPAICGIDLNVTTHPAQTSIELHLANPAGLVELATWATELGAVVEFCASKDFVGCCARTVFHGRPVEVWTHVKQREAAELLAHFGRELIEGQPVGVDAVEVLSLLSPAVEQTLEQFQTEQSAKTVARRAVKVGA